MKTKTKLKPRPKVKNKKYNSEAIIYGEAHIINIQDIIEHNEFIKYYDESHYTKEIYNPLPSIDWSEQWRGPTKR